MITPMKNITLLVKRTRIIHKKKKHKIKEVNEYNKKF